MTALFREIKDDYVITKGRQPGLMFLSTVTNDSGVGTAYEWSHNPSTDWVFLLKRKHKASSSL